MFNSEDAIICYLYNKKNSLQKVQSNKIENSK